jgi:glucokinase
MSAPSTQTGCVIGVDLGGTKLLAGVVGPDLAVRHRVRRRAFGLDQATLMATIVEAVEEARAAVNEEIVSVGFGIPVTLDRRTGAAAYSTHLPLAGVPFAAVMSERLGLPVVVDNDGNCAVLAETRFGAAAGASDVVMLTLGTGIGGGLVIDGKLHLGATGTAGEIGHQTVKEDGPKCGCGNRGCAEALAQAGALTRAAGTTTVEAVFDGADAGDERCQAAIDQAVDALGIAIGNVVTVLVPDRVVIGGGIADAGERIMGPLRAAVQRRTPFVPAGGVDLRLAELGAGAGAIGAALAGAEAA